MSVSMKWVPPGMRAGDMSQSLERLFTVVPRVKQNSCKKQVSRADASWSLNGKGQFSLHRRLDRDKLGDERFQNSVGYSPMYRPTSCALNHSVSPCL